MSQDTRAIEQLIAMRRLVLEDLRKDLLTLNQIVDECTRKAKAAKAEEVSFLEELRRLEADAERMVAAQMLQWRRYLDHLQQLTGKARKALDEVSVQRQHAQDAFDESYAEIRTLERLAEKRLEAQRLERQRRDYLLADDQEILRSERNRSTHGAN